MQSYTVGKIVEDLKVYEEEFEKTDIQLPNEVKDLTIDQIYELLTRSYKESGRFDTIPNNPFGNGELRKLFLIKYNSPYSV